MATWLFLLDACCAVVNLILFAIEANKILMLILHRYDIVYNETLYVHD